LKKAQQISELSALPYQYAKRHKQAEQANFLRQGQGFGDALDSFIPATQLAAPPEQAGRTVNAGEVQLSKLRAI